MKIQAYRNGKEANTFETKEQAVTELSKWGSFNDEEGEEEFELDENSVMYLFFDNDGDEIICSEEEEEESFADQVNDILSGLGFSKSTNNSWYWKNEIRTIRISDHNKLYPSETLFNDSFVIDSAEELDKKLDEIIKLMK